eukprot:14892618-Alexandrium_andersonii.AAC.1
MERWPATLRKPPCAKRRTSTERAVASSAAGPGARAATTAGSRAAAPAWRPGRRFRRRVVAVR